MKNTRTDEDRAAAVEYGRKLREARATWNISLLDVAAAARVSVTSIRNWERGDCLPEYMAAKRVQRYIRQVGREARDMLRRETLRALTAERDPALPRLGRPPAARPPRVPEGMA